jgi:diguanylate cyclase (GGDEF)-like protein
MKTEEPWQAIDEHLKQARQILHQLSPGLVKQTAPGVSMAPEELVRLYRDSERRANEAVVNLSKMEREVELLRSQTTESIRQVQRLAYQDALTGLANMNLIHQYLDSVKQIRGGDNQVLLFLVDLDRFRVVNEVLGPQSGDTLLTRVGERLSLMVGPQDALARRYEDEFLLVFSHIAFKDVMNRAQQLASEVRRALSAPFILDGQKFEITASVGASYFPELAQSTQQLIQQADSALSHVKKQGRDQFCLYSSHLKSHFQRNSTLEFQMRHGLDAGEFFMEYLPIVMMEKTRAGLEGRLVGVEALIRWQHRVEGLLPPSEFLPQAERSGFVVAMGHWALQQICRQIQMWSQAGVQLFTNVNLCGRQLLQVDMAKEIIAIVGAHNVPADNLTFEFDEAFGNLEEDHIELNIQRLEQAGFSLAIDKFGAGFSSLNRLSRVRFLKLSRQLVQGNRELCRKGILMARGLDLLTIGVGVEDLDAARFLLENGCAMAQGYLFSKPVRAAQIEQLCLSNHRWKL